MSKPQQRTLKSQGLEICFFEWSGRGRPLIFVHATGFHARCWDQVIAGFRDRHCIALDMPGHGRSESPDKVSDWLGYAQTVIDLVDSLDLADVLAIGHSMGGHSISFAALQRPKRFGGLVLIDPVMTDPEKTPLWTEIDPAELPIVRRRNHFASADEMYELFKTKLPFQTWDAAVLRDYCDYGLLPAHDGFELACSPLFEAQTYVASGPQLSLEELAQIRIPVDVVRARPRDPKSLEFNFQLSPTWPKLAEHLPQGQDHLLAELSHFIPMEEPALTIELIREAEQRVSQRKP